jgi:DNA-binding PadR family transcriptional regulator
MPKNALDPLPSAAFYILVALAGGDLHGYGIMREVSGLTAGRVKLGPGTLYGSVRTLLEAGLIKELDERPSEDAGGERRRYYRMTPAGRKIASAEADRLAEMVRIARERKIFRGSHV